MHADHITGSGILKALLPSCQSAIAKVGGGQADMLLDDGQVLEYGEQVWWKWVLKHDYTSWMILWSL